MANQDSDHVENAVEGETVARAGAMAAESDADPHDAAASAAAHLGCDDSASDGSPPFSASLPKDAAQGSTASPDTRSPAGTEPERDPSSTPSAAEPQIVADEGTVTPAVVLSAATESQETGSQEPERDLSSTPSAPEPQIVADKGTVTPAVGAATEPQETGLQETGSQEPERDASSTPSAPEPQIVADEGAVGAATESQETGSQEPGRDTPPAPEPQIVADEGTVTVVLSAATESPETGSQEPGRDTPSTPSAPEPQIVADEGTVTPAVGAAAESQETGSQEPERDASSTPSGPEPQIVADDGTVTPAVGAATESQETGSQEPGRDTPSAPEPQIVADEGTVTPAVGAATESQETGSQETGSHPVLGDAHAVVPSDERDSQAAVSSDAPDAVGDDRPPPLAAASVSADASPEPVVPVGTTASENTVPSDTEYSGDDIEPVALCVAKFSVPPLWGGTEAPLFGDADAGHEGNHARVVCLSAGRKRARSIEKPSLGAVEEEGWDLRLSKEKFPPPSPPKVVLASFNATHTCGRLTGPFTPEQTGGSFVCPGCQESFTLAIPPLSETRSKWNYPYKALEGDLDVLDKAPADGHTPKDKHWHRRHVSLSGCRLLVHKTSKCAETGKKPLWDYPIVGFKLDFSSFRPCAFEVSHPNCPTLVCATQSNYEQAMWLSNLQAQGLATMSEEVLDASSKFVDWEITHSTMYDVSLGLNQVDEHMMVTFRYKILARSHIHHDFAAILAVDDHHLRLSEEDGQTQFNVPVSDITSMVASPPTEEPVLILCTDTGDVSLHFGYYSLLMHAERAIEFRRSADVMADVEQYSMEMSRASASGLMDLSRASVSALCNTIWNQHSPRPILSYKQYWKGVRVFDPEPVDAAQASRRARPAATGKVRKIRHRRESIFS